MDADLTSPRRVRLGVFVLVALLHLVAVLALIRAFAPDFTQAVIERAVSAVTVTITTPPPEPPAPPAAKAERAEGASGAAGRKAVPREMVAPKPRIPIAKQPAPQVASTGAGLSSGAREAGEGTGAGGPGSGTGSGRGGEGQGGGQASKAVKLSGDINSARDYPAASRDLRLGDYVIVALTVGTDGRVRACRVHRASRDAQADRITCQLAQQRFRFRPATDASGQPIEAVFGWQQRWFAPSENK